MAADGDDSGLPPQKKRKHAGQQVLIRAKDSECTAEVFFDRSSLKQSDYFKEGLARWKQQDALPTFDLVLPEGSSAPKGLQLWKKRVSAVSSTTKGEDEETSWSPVDWWRASNRDATALLAALYMFDHTMRADYRKEVAVTVMAFRITCPEPYFSILCQDDKAGLGLRRFSKEYNRFKLCERFRPSEQALKVLLDKAIEGGEEAFALADRALAAFSAEELVPILFKTYSQAFTLAWEKADSSIECIRTQNWLETHIERLAGKSFAAVLAMFGLIFDGLKQAWPKSRKRILCLLTLVGSLVDPLVHGMLLEGASRDRLREDEQPSIKSAFSQMIEHVEQIRALLHEKGEDDLECYSMGNLFEVTHPLLQLAMLEATASFATRHPDAPMGCLIECLQGRVNTVAPEARHVLLNFANALSKEDIAFLAEADLPGL